MRLATPLFLLLALLALMATAACGGGSGPRTVDLDFKGYDDFSYNRESVEVPAGASVVVNFENEGALDHSWVLISSRVEAATATDADAIAGATTGAVPAGESSTVTFTAPPPGEYEFICTVPGHAASGMKGSFIVRPGS